MLSAIKYPRHWRSQISSLLRAGCMRAMVHASYWFSTQRAAQQLLPYLPFGVCN